MYGLGDFERGVTLPIGAQSMTVCTYTEGFFFCGQCTFAHNDHSGLTGTPVPPPALNLQTLELVAACSLERLFSAYKFVRCHSRF